LRKSEEYVVVAAGEGQPRKKDFVAIAKDRESETLYPTRINAKPAAGLAAKLRMKSPNLIPRRWQSGTIYTLL
jgi:hypothetical protein